MMRIVARPSHVGDHDFNGLRSLAEAAKDRFCRGIVLYTGSHTVPFGSRLHAVPLSMLWTPPAR